MYSVTCNHLNSVNHLFSTNSWQVKAYFSHFVSDALKWKNEKSFVTFVLPTSIQTLVIITGFCYFVINCGGYEKKKKKMCSHISVSK